LESRLDVLEVLLLDDATDPTKGVQNARRLVSEDKVAPLFPSSGTASSAVANGRFSSGNVAMYVDGPWQLINLKKKSNFTIGLAPVPARLLRGVQRARTRPTACATPRRRCRGRGRAGCRARDSTAARARLYGQAWRERGRHMKERRE
jgi:hypothetical protein